MAFVQSPLNYTGGKVKLLPQILPLFPKKINTFVDLFCGGCNVGLNVDATTTVYNDLDRNLMYLYHTLKNLDKQAVFEWVYQIIDKYGLSLVSVNGYDHYNCDSSDGLGSYNRDKFLKLRDDFNNKLSEDYYYYIVLYVLILLRFYKNFDIVYSVIKRNKMKEIDTELAFKQIKKQNGEAVAKVLRSEILLDIPNLTHILEFAGNDPDKIKALAPVIREIYKNKNTPEYQTDKTPLELLSEAGYDAFVVTTEKEKNSIKKYYRLGEEICTFRDPERHINYYMIHAVKHGAEKIKPSKRPEREDEYGTSVISIQIAKGGGFISIKNRYNHTVNNPDATFNNNPDNIIPGLSTSLKKYFDVDFSVSESRMPDNFRMVHDQFVYFNHEVNNTYFGPDYYFSGSTITKLNTDYEVMLDYYVLNVKTGEVRDVAGLKDQTHKILQDMFQNKKITIRTNPNNKHERMIYADDAHVLSVEKGTITELNLPNIKRIGDNFLILNENMKTFNAPKLEQVGHQFLTRNKHLIKINTPCLERTGCCFLHDNIELTKLELPSLKEIADHCLVHNTTLSKLYVPKLEKIGPIFLMENLSLPELDLPLVKEVGDGFLRDNKILKRFYAPKLEKFGDTVMYYNLGLTELNLPSLQEVGYDFLSENKKLKTFYAPKLQKIKWGFLIKNTGLTDIVVANDEIIHNKHNKRLTLILAKNKIKKKLKNSVNGLISVIARDGKH